jgi:hypothetical protein
MSEMVAMQKPLNGIVLQAPVSHSESLPRRWADFPLEQQPEGSMIPGSRQNCRASRPGLPADRCLPEAMTSCVWNAERLSIYTAGWNIRGSVYSTRSETIGVTCWFPPQNLSSGGCRVSRSDSCRATACMTLERYRSPPA